MFLYHGCVGQHNLECITRCLRMHLHASRKVQAPCCTAFTLPTAHAADVRTQIRQARSQCALASPHPIPLPLTANEPHQLSHSYLYRERLHWIRLAHLLPANQSRHGRSPRFCCHRLNTRCHLHRQTLPATPDTQLRHERARAKRRHREPYSDPGILPPAQHPRLTAPSHAQRCRCGRTPYSGLARQAFAQLRSVGNVQQNLLLAHYNSGTQLAHSWRLRCLTCRA